MEVDTSVDSALEKGFSRHSKSHNMEEVRENHVSPGTKKEMPVVQVGRRRPGRGKLTSGLKKGASGQGRALGGRNSVMASVVRSSGQETYGAPHRVPACISGSNGEHMTVESLQHSLPQGRMDPGARGRWSL